MADPDVDDHDLLIRIDERLTSLVKAVELLGQSQAKMHDEHGHRLGHLEGLALKTVEQRDWVIREYARSQSRYAKRTQVETGRRIDLPIYILTAAMIFVTLLPFIIELLKIVTGHG